MLNDVVTTPTGICIIHAPHFDLPQLNVLSSSSTVENSLEGQVDTHEPDALPHACKVRLEFRANLQ